MKLVIIGSGNVATVLGRKFKAAGHQILQVAGRNTSMVRSLATEWNSDWIKNLEKINQQADIYLIAVNDDAITDVAANLNLSGKIVAHTAASVSKDILKNVTDHFGVFYPLQSLRKEMTELPVIPICYDGSSEKALKSLEALAVSISPSHVSMAGDETRSKLHLAAVFANNFSNHLYTLVEEYCKKERINFKELFPLIEETATRLKHISPQISQTGPAVRNDEETIMKQLAMLVDDPELKKIYECMTGSILSFKNK